MANLRFDPNGIVASAQSKPLPLLLLLDVSGSMGCRVPMEKNRYTTRIAELNQAVRSMLSECADLCRSGMEVTVGFIIFSNGASVLHVGGDNTFTPADRVHWQDRNAGGGTALGAALTLGKQIIESREEIPARAYRPMVILISDGEPNDDWRGPMRDFVREGRSAKCERLALMIGSDCPTGPMEDFTEGCAFRPVRACTAGQISRFFKFISQSVSTRSRSQKPNETPGAGRDLQSVVDGSIRVEDFFTTCATPGTDSGDIYDM